MGAGKSLQMTGFEALVPPAGRRRMFHAEDDADGDGSPSVNRKALMAPGPVKPGLHQNFPDAKGFCTGFPGTLSGSLQRPAAWT
jgi:hypothetical protein